MAEKHKIYSAGGGQWRDYMYAMWDFVHNQQTGILQFVDDGGIKSVYLGSSFWNGSDALTAVSFTSGSYIVVEPTEAYPGGGEWQVKFLCGNPTGTGAGTGDMSVKMSFSGGWNATTNTDFASVSTVVTDVEQLTNNIIAASDTIYISCSNSDTYDSDKKYSYFRFLNWNQSSSEDEKFEGVYAGGYIPADVTSDTRPSVLMCRIVTVLNTSNSWGKKQVAEDLCVVPGDYAHTSAGGINAGFAGTGDSTGVPYYSNSRGGKWVNAPCLLTDETAQVVLGSFGKYTMLHGSESRTDGASDSALEYMVAGALMLRWKPSA